MQSRFEYLRPKAVTLRKEGRSIRDVEVLLSIPRSTLSGWFKIVSLTKSQRTKLKKNFETGLIKARAEASKWHKADKVRRIAITESTAQKTLDALPRGADINELALAFLYLGEGAKTQSKTALGSSDPRIARFFVQGLREIYTVPTGDIKCYLHLRADQKPMDMMKYWSRELGLPIVNFKKPSIDMRTVGRSTYPEYKGVCLIECGRVEIQRRLMYIANGFCERASGYGSRRRP